MPLNLSNKHVHLCHTLGQIPQDTTPQSSWLPPEEHVPYYTLELPRYVTTPEHAWICAGAEVNFFLESAHVVARTPDGAAHKAAMAELRELRDFGQLEGAYYDREANKVTVHKNEDNTYLLLIHPEAIEDTAILNALKDSLQSTQSSWRSRLQATRDDSSPGREY